MNIKLFPNEVGVEFYFTPPEIYKCADDIKIISINNEGTIIIAITKINEIKIIDFMGKCLIDNIKYFNENNLNIKSINWSFDYQSIFVIYEKDAFNVNNNENIDKNIKNKISGFQKIYFNVKNQPFYNINFGNDDYNFNFYETEEHKIKEIVEIIRNNNKILIVSGTLPFFYNVSLKTFTYLFNFENNNNNNNDNNNDNNNNNNNINSINNNNNSINNNNNDINNNINSINNNNNNIQDQIDSSSILESNYTYIIKESNNINSFFIFIKELFIIILISIKPSNSTENNNNNNIENLLKNTKHFNYNQLNFLKKFLNQLNNNFYAISINGQSINGEILSIQINSIKTLILINSSDRSLRLFSIIEDKISLQKEYTDNVNKKRYINCYFYTYKIKNNFEDLILTALCDSNSLEFEFIDIESNKTTKKLEPFKYNVQDFICHYKNHFSILVISNKKIFNISGIIINQWGSFAPGLKYIEENIEYVEEESFYDNFEKKMKNGMKNNVNLNLLDECFKVKNSKNENLFYYFNKDEENDININEKNKSLNDIKEVFNYLNENLQ